MQGFFQAAFHSIRRPRKLIDRGKRCERCRHFPAVLDLLPPREALLIEFLRLAIVALYLAELSQAMKRIGPAGVIFAIEQAKHFRIALLRF